MAESDWHMATAIPSAVLAYLRRAGRVDEISLSSATDLSD
jgi:hypothetical protein